MAAYQYKAVDKTGQPARGSLEAANEVDLELRLRRMGLDLITCKQVDRRSKSIGAGGAITRQDLINFCFDMEQMAKSGIPILDGLRDLRDSLENPRFREVLTSMIEDMEGGKVLSQCMSAQPETFEKVFVSLVAARSSVLTASAIRSFRSGRNEIRRCGVLPCKRHKSW